MGEELYNLLPNIYKEEDSKIKPDPLPLKRFMQVVGTGLDFMREKIDGHFNLYDIDKCPPEFLPHLFRQIGFDIPYEMTEIEQRGLLKLVPTLYKLKGTSAVFDYLARQIYSKEATTNVVWKNRTYNPDGTVKDRNRIVITIDVNEGTGEDKIAQKLELFSKQAEKFRPVNHELFPSIILYYEDKYNEDRSRFDDSYHYEEVKTYDNETYAFQAIKEEVDKEIMTIIDTELKDYTKDTVIEYLDQLFVDDGMEDNYSLPNFGDSHSEQVALDDGDEDFDVKSAVEEVIEVLRDVVEETYNMDRNSDTVEEIVAMTDEDVYTQKIAEDSEGVMLDWTHSLNSETKRLNTLRLSIPTKITQL
ncbi:hypothetical protein F400_gp081 [Bacillus phage BCD7]|uniref:Uncharacterized protein n=1 Tax=Bacillus phage BCD7 TaxID=1136534 RepID=J9PTZ2_9CAUD|nr:hypothetical protein F400_gp081 [Bacillus phage BCD7]AEZ50528.1 hypothetical protein BCD7_0081 [Bacillus phage BCD7]